MMMFVDASFKGKPDVTLRKSVCTPKSHLDFSVEVFFYAVSETSGVHRGAHRCQIDGPGKHDICVYLLCKLLVLDVFENMEGA
jgi:hypothetical protein